MLLRHLMTLTALALLVVAIPHPASAVPLLEHAIEMCVIDPEHEAISTTEGPCGDEKAWAELRDGSFCESTRFDGNPGHC